MAAETLKSLGLDGRQMDRVKKVPYGELLAAGIAANQTVGKQLGRSLDWNPIADDVYVLREFCDWAASIPFIAGTVMSEFNSNLSEVDVPKNEWTEKQVEDRVTAAFGAKKDAVVAEFRKVYPGKKVQDVVFLDNLFRPGMKCGLAERLEKATAPTYNYLFTYEYQVNGGVTAFHCSELAFVFHALNEPHMRLATGGVASALALQDTVSQAWVNFARTGNPSQPGLAWTPYSLAGKQTIIFDTVSAVRSHDDDKLLSLLPPPLG